MGNIRKTIQRTNKRPLTDLELNRIIESQAKKLGVRVNWSNKEEQFFELCCKGVTLEEFTEWRKSKGIYTDKSLVEYFTEKYMKEVFGNEREVADFFEKLGMFE